ncbi:MAG: Gfo/Idh/MocA family oxidoreductase [bacterium]
MKDIRLGLVGCGAVTERYYLPILRRLPEICHNLYLVDRNLAQAESLRSRLPGVRIAQDHREILDRVDGAVLCVPHRLHHPIAMDFLRKGRPVLCEKPLAESAREARAMVRAAVASRAALAVNNTRRLFPSHRKIKELLAAGELGRVRSVRYFEACAFAWPSATGFYVDPRHSDRGVLLDVGPHVLDLICWWLQGRPELLSYEDDSFGGPESICHLRARKGDCTIEVRLNRLFDLPSRFRIECEQGSLEGTAYGWDRLIRRARNGTVKKIRLPSGPKLYADFVQPVFLNFMDVISKGKPPLVPGAEVIPSIEWIEACYQDRSRFALPWNEHLEAVLV